MTGSTGDAALREGGYGHCEMTAHETPPAENTSPIDHGPTPQRRPAEPDRFGPRPLWDPEAIPAATIIPLREGSTGLELLMLRRDSELRFAGGMWVFPGGRIDPEDFPAPPSEPAPTHDELEAAARVAVTRELAEEAGVPIEASTIRRWSQWTPPPRAEATEDLVRHRFTTAFYVGVVIGDTDAVTIDDGEIREHRWVSATEMLELHAAGEVTMVPPTFVTLEHLAPMRSTAEVLMGAPGGRNGPAEVEHFSTRVGTTGEGWAALYHGDVAYDSLDMAAEGPKHRLWVDQLPWRYERTERR